KPHPMKPNVIAAEKPDNWHPAPGYTWVDFEKHDFVVKWTPDLRHPTRENVVAGPTPGEWQPAAGYSWVEAGKTDRVMWTPGSRDPKHPNIVAADEPDKWYPAEGYEWVVSPKEGDMRVKPYDKLKDITSGWDSGTFTHDVLFTNGSGSD